MLESGFEEKERDLLRQAFSVALTARENGNHPFGAVLADRAGTVLLEAENTVVSDRDLTGHAELNLVRRLSSELAPEVIREASVYSSAEPCPMCAGAIHWSGIARLVYGLSAKRLYEISARDKQGIMIDVPCREILSRSSRTIKVVGPALREEAEEVHAGFWK